MTTTTAPRARRGSARAALLAGGTRLFAHHAIDGVAIDDIARESGVAKGSFYVHFADREAFAVAVGARIRAAVEAATATANAGIADPVERIAGAFAVVVRHAARHPHDALAWSRIDGSQYDPTFALNAGVVGDLTAAMAAGSIDPVSREVALLSVIALTRVAALRVASEASDAAWADARGLGVAMLRALGLAAGDASARIAAALTGRAGADELP